MAAQDRYSLHRYSLGSADNRIFIEQTFTESLGGLAGAAVPVNMTAYFSDSLQMTSRGTVALPLRFEAGDSLQGSATANADIQLCVTFADALEQSAYASKDIRCEMLGVDALGGTAYAGKIMPCKWSAADALFGRSYACKEIRGAIQFFDALEALSAATLEETESVSISVAIPPGAELRIDSDAFTVTLNGENILYAQLGDWINVSRDLLRLDIESGSGGDLSGSLIYTERYL